MATLCKDKIHAIPTVAMISEMDLGDILTTALEGGINYWFNEDFIGIDSERDDEGNPESFTFEDLEADRGKKKKYTITLEKLVEALIKLANNPGKYFNGHTGYRFNYDDYDANDADIVFQIAAFDEVIYG
jgi:hypothetical protein